MKEHSDELLAEATRDELFACIRLLAISVVQHRAKCGFVTFEDSATQLRTGTQGAEEFGMFVEGKQVLEEALEMAKSFATEGPLGPGPVTEEPPSNLLAENRRQLRINVTAPITDRLFKISDSFSLIIESYYTDLVFVHANQLMTLKHLV